MKSAFPATAIILYVERINRRGSSSLHTDDVLPAESSRGFSGCFTDLLPLCHYVSVMCLQCLLHFSHLYLKKKKSAISYRFPLLFLYIQAGKWKLDFGTKWKILPNIVITRLIPVYLVITSIKTQTHFFKIYFCSTKVSCPLCSFERPPGLQV